MKKNKLMFWIIVMLLPGIFILSFLLGEAVTEPILSLNSSLSSIIFNDVKHLELAITYENLIDGNLTYRTDLLTVSNLTNGSRVSNGDKLPFDIKGTSPGHATLEFILSKDSKEISTSYTQIVVKKSTEWETVSDIIGWLYFVAWSVSFYPQIYDNWKRKSVVGLNFDFLALNIVGFVLYSLFNGGLFWISTVKDEYARLHPGGLNPIMINDIVFSFHATFAVVVTIAQCYTYEREDQKVSIIARVIIGAFFVFLLISLICASVAVISWLDFLYYCSYVKLAITLIKYIPQAWMNYRRKSTIGWSIGNVLLDFTGGMLSMLQMIINAWNYDDWASIFGDPTKFGLGLFSVIFDIFFIIQHYILYRKNYLDIPGETVTSVTNLVS